MPELTLNHKLVDYVTMTSAAMEKVAEEEQARRAKAAEVAAMIPVAVKAMVDNERIKAAQADRLAALLEDPAQALDLLAKVAAHRNSAEVADDAVRLGRPTGDAPSATTKRASHRQAFVGQRSSVPAESDINFLAALGLHPQG